MVNWNRQTANGEISDSSLAAIAQSARAKSEDCACLPEEQLFEVIRVIFQLIAADYDNLPPIRKFRKQFEDCMDMVDIELLCAELNITFENIKGDTKSLKIVYLVREFQKRSQLSVLMDYLRMERPNMAWVDITTMS
jgi:hypothetical protein